MTSVHIDLPDQRLVVLWDGPVPRWGERLTIGDTDYMVHETGWCLELGQRPTNHYHILLGESDDEVSENPRRLDWPACRRAEG